MAVDLAPEHKKLLEQIALENGFKNQILEIGSGSEKGDGYTGQLVRITIKSGGEELKIVLKVAHDNPFVRLNFKREIFMYKTVFETFKKFQIDNDYTDGFNYHAKFYGDCEEKGKEALALEDLYESGLKLWNRKVPMNAKHISLVLKLYGKFHAVSFAMRNKNPELFKTLAKHFAQEEPELDHKVWIEPMLDAIRQSLPRIAKGDIRVQETVEKALEEGEKFLKLDIGEDNKLVITHGDCWCNNMMFKYENPNDETEPTKVCLIDFQVSRISSPVVDLCYFLGANSPEEILYNYVKYLKIYHESLSDSLKAMNCDPEAVFPFSKLMEHWRNFAKFFAYIAPTVFNIMTVDKENATDMKGTGMGDFIKHLNSAGPSAADRRTYAVYKFLTVNDLL